MRYNYPMTNANALKWTEGNAKLTKTGGEREAYLSGAYDVRCDLCEGAGKVRVPVLSALSPEDREAYQEHLDNEAYYERERAAERRMGA